MDIIYFDKAKASPSVTLEQAEFYGDTSPLWTYLRLEGGRTYKVDDLLYIKGFSSGFLLMTARN